MKISLISNELKDKGYVLSRLICSRLHEFNADIFLSKDAKEVLPLDYVNYVDNDELYCQPDVLIVIGGDGAILHASMNAVKRQTPILGVNSGRVGFMAGLELNELDKLGHIFDGNYQIDNRMMLEVRSNSGNGVYYALNDAVISRADFSGIMDISVECTGKTACSYRADGVIISTPTGSTAYSLSAGGPVIDPHIECIEVTPICPHSLVSRSIIFEQNSELCIIPTSLNGNEYYLVVDGRNVTQLTSGEKVNIKKSEYMTKLIKLKDTPFYEVLKNKMNDKGI